MGRWEVTDEAVNVAMSDLRQKTLTRQNSSGRRNIMKVLDRDVERLGHVMLAEQQRQAEDLRVRMAVAGVTEGAIKKEMAMDTIQVPGHIPAAHPPHRT